LETYLNKSNMNNTEVDKIKDAYIEHLKKKDGCLIMVDKWINVEGNFFLNIIGLDCYGEPLYENIEESIITEWSETYFNK